MIEIPNWRWKGIAAILGGFLIHITLGNGYSFGNVMTYSASYMHSRVSSSVGYGNFIWVGSIATASQGGFMVLGGILCKLTGPKFTCLCGCTIFCTGIILTYFTVSTSLVTLVLTYGLMGGFGTSVAYATPLACGTMLFPKRKGLINGLIVGGFGLGALFSTSIQTYYLNPDNISPDSDGYFRDNSILDRVPKMFFLLGGVLMAVDYVGISLLRRPPLVKNDDKISVIEESSTINHNSINKSSTVADLTPKEVLRGRLFYVLWTVYVLNGVGISYINSLYKTFGQTFIKDDHFLSMVGSLAALFNASGRILWGRIIDRTSFKTTLRIMSSLFALLMATLPLTKHMGKPGFTIWVWLIFLTFSGIFAIMPTVSEKAFGSKYHASIYGLLFSSQSVSGPLTAAVNQLMLEAIGFTGCFLTVAGIILLAVVMSFFVPKGL